jgi:hypothetical protein
MAFFSSGVTEALYSGLAMNTPWCCCHHPLELEMRVRLGGRTGFEIAVVERHLEVDRARCASPRLPPAPAPCRQRRELRIHRAGADRAGKDQDFSERAWRCSL